MRKKLSMRVGAIILSATMLVTSVTPAMAAKEDVAQTEVSQNAVEEMTEAAVTEQTVSENMVEETISENAVEENVSENAVPDESLEQAGAYDGTPSKVIGVEWEVNSHYIDMGVDGKLPYGYKHSTKSDSFIGTKDDLNALKVFEDGIYLYKGIYYQEADIYTSGRIDLTDSVKIMEGKKSDYYTSDSGLYKINGIYYSYLGEYTKNGKTYITISDDGEVVPVGKFKSDDEAVKICGVKDACGKTKYYVVNGKYYKSLYYRTLGNGEHLYYVKCEILFNGTEPYLYWMSLTSDEKKTINGEKLLVGYEVELNGKTFPGTRVATYSNGSKSLIFTNTSCYPDISLSVGENISGRVRGVYYYGKQVETKDSLGNTIKETQYLVDKVGEWSDLSTYQFKGFQKAGDVSGMKAEVYSNNRIKLIWNPAKEATYYNIWRIASKKPISGMNREVFYQFYHRTGDVYKASGLVGGSDYKTSLMGDYDTQYLLDITDKEYPYNYFMVRTVSIADGYYNTEKCSNVASVVMNTNAYVPQVKNLRIENLNDGTFNITFDPILNKTVYIYAYESNTFPALYNYNDLSLKTVKKTTTSSGATETSTQNFKLSDLPYDQQVAINKVKMYEASGTNGSVSSTKFSLKPGVTYYFVAHTYDTINASIDRAPYTTVKNLSYTRYNDVSPVSNMVSQKCVLEKPSVSTTSDTKTSIKLSMSSDNATGYEIYKKSGKKYKKIATTTNCYYVDGDLKQNTNYSYKIRAYYYNKDSKKSCYSDYTFVTGETTSVKNISLTLKKKSKTSVNLSWNKVSGVTKYEIYRSNVENTDESIVSKKFYDETNYTEILSNQKFQLVKTLSAKKKSYTDKKLIEGETYTYVIFAHSKNGKKNVYISDSDMIALELQSPQNVQATLKKGAAKVTWEKDSFASKYELKYTIYDSEGYATTKTPVKVSTKKAAYTIKNIPSGGYATVTVRAYGKNKKYSLWSSTKAITSLATTSKIKATNTVVNGKAAVKITWKGVSGAKYYKVYRSTTEGQYNQDEKKYYAHGVNISKEANDDENNDSVIYEQYYGASGSIVGNVAYDYALLDEGVQYYYYVIAYGEKETDIASYVSSSSTSRSYASGKPASVVYKGTITPKLKNSKKGQVKITYNKIAGAKKYEIYRSDKKNGKYKKIASTKKTTYTDKKAKKGKTYYYKVVAKGKNALKADLNVTSSAKKIKVKK